MPKEPRSTCTICGACYEGVGHPKTIRTPGTPSEDLDAINIWSSLPKKLHQQAGEEAARRGVSLSKLTREALRFFLEHAGGGG